MEMYCMVYSCSIPNIHVNPCQCCWAPSAAVKANHKIDGDVLYGLQLLNSKYSCQSMSMLFALCTILNIALVKLAVLFCILDFCIHFRNPVRQTLTFKPAASLPGRTTVVSLKRADLWGR
eukprot:403848_1